MADRGLTGVLLVGGASSRFGAPKALARFGGTTLAEHAWALLGEVCDERLAVGKTADALMLPFAVTDDGTDVRAPLAGLVAGLRAATHDVCLMLPVDVPRVTPLLLRRLADACDEVAVVASGPLPGAYRRSTLPALEARLRSGRLKLREALTGLRVRTIPADPAELLNVNTPADLDHPSSETPLRCL